MDISEWMVTRGQAIAFRKYSLDYVGDEDRAKAGKIGIWAGEFQDPSDFRRQSRGARPSLAYCANKAWRVAPASVRPTLIGRDGNAAREALIYARAV
jgi:hypothetical protein